MEIQTIELRKLMSTEGCFITQSILIDESARIFSDCVYLAIGDSPDNWIEWTIEQKEEWEKNNIINEVNKEEELIEKEIEETDTQIS